MAQFEIKAPRISSPEDLALAWSQQDVENRLGFKGGRYTNVNHIPAFIAGVVLTGLTFALMVFVFKRVPLTSFIAEMFLRPGNQFTVVPATTFFFFGVSVLLIKRAKLRFQRRTLDLQAMPDAADFVLNESTAALVLSRIHTLVDHPRHFTLLNRIDRALSNLRNIGQIGDVSSILRAQAENDEDQVASSYTLVNGLVWAIPVLGFIGTVQGLSVAIGNFGLTLQNAADLSVIRTSLQGVTGGLATAFETTLVALVFALILQLWITMLQRQEMAFLDECNDYCHSHVVARLRITPKSPEVASVSPIPA